jgi:hypothetical protein
MPHELSVSALVPDRFGLSVVDVEQLLTYLADGQPLEEAIINSAFDTVDTDEIVEAVGRLRTLNETGDAAAYWDRA